jgi:hypothetical protein
MRRALMLALGVLLSGLSTPARAEDRLVLEVLVPKVGQYEKTEFRIRMEREYQNPFDPEEVELSLHLTAPSGARIVLPAFFGQDYRRDAGPPTERRRDWFYPVGMPGWKARFAAAEPGQYSAVARRRDAQGTSDSNPVRFEVAPSARRGFVRASRQDPRFFAFDDGTPYFAIGHNHAFVGQGQYANLGRTEEIFAEIGKNGGNFLRIWVCCHDWATAIEARKSAWGRSWAWRPPIVPMPRREGDPRAPKCVEIKGERGGALSVSPTHPLAAVPETRYVLSGKVRTEPGTMVEVLLGGKALGAPIQILPSQPAPHSTDGWLRFSREFTTGKGQYWIDSIAFRREGPAKAWLDGLSLREVDPASRKPRGPELLWEADVNRSERGFYNPVDCFVVDKLVEAAAKTGIYLQLTILTRDLYMGSLKDPNSPEYQRAIADAQKLMRYAVARWGYSTHVAAWEYFNEIDPGLPTDRFYAEVGKHLEQIDPYRHLRTTSTWHPSPKDWKHPQLDIAQAHHYLRPDAKEGFKDEVDVLLKQTRSLLERTPSKPAMMAEFGLAENNFQRSAYMKQDQELVHFHNAIWASALSGSAGTAAFWWWELLDQMGAYRHYRPLSAFLADVPWTTAGLREASATATKGLRIVGLQGRQCAYLWLFDPQACWWNVVVEKKTPPTVDGAAVEVRDLAPGAYRVEWWDTRTGHIVRTEHAAAEAGTIQAAAPPFARDLACKVVRRKD